MCTLSLEESREVKKTGMDLTAQDDPFLMSWAGLKSLDMTHVRVAYGSITTVDLSGNLLMTLPDSFSSCLRHVQYLDLSRNRLTCLPHNFGKMENLHTLLVYMNKLETLPVSFRKLDNLRWLDISSNPLEPRLLEICGQDLTYCEVVARNIIEFMRDLHNAKESAEVPTPTTSHQKLREISVLPMEAMEEETRFTSDGDTMEELEEDDFKSKNLQLKNQCVDEPEVVIPDLTTKSKSKINVEESSLGLSSMMMTAFYCVLLTVSLFIVMSLSLALYNQGPPKGLLNGGRLQNFDNVPPFLTNSLAWAVHICPKCVPYRESAVQTIVVEDSFFFRSFVNIFFHPLYNLFN